MSISRTRFAVANASSISFWTGLPRQYGRVSVKLLRLVQKGPKAQAPQMHVHLFRYSGSVCRAVGNKKFRMPPLYSPTKHSAGSVCESSALTRGGRVIEQCLLCPFRWQRRFLSRRIDRNGQKHCFVRALPYVLRDEFIP